MCAVFHLVKKVGRCCAFRQKLQTSQNHFRACAVAILQQALLSTTSVHLVLSDFVLG